MLYFVSFHSFHNLPCITMIFLAKFCLTKKKEEKKNSINIMILTFFFIHSLSLFFFIQLSVLVLYLFIIFLYRQDVGICWLSLRDDHQCRRWWKRERGMGQVCFDVCLRCHWDHQGRRQGFENPKVSWIFRKNVNYHFYDYFLDLYIFFSYLVA